MTISRMEAKEAQNAQIILGNARGSIANKTHTALRGVGKTTDIVVSGAIPTKKQRVHREVAPLGITPPVAAEGDLGVTAVSLDILAQRGHLERLALGHHRDGAVLNPGRHRL